MSEVLLPPSASPEELAMEQATARVGAVPVPVREVWDADTCPVGILPWLAWAYSLDEWDAAWTETQQRTAIKRSVELHRYKGTIGAVRDALAALGYGVQVQEWFNESPPGPEYTYRLLLEADQVGIDQEALQKIFQVVDSYKNLRSHMTEAVPGVVTDSEVFTGGVLLIGTDMDVDFQYSLVANGFATANGDYNANGIRI